MITPSFGLTATERVLPRLALDWTTGLTQPGVDVVRAGVATFVGSNGLIQSATADTQRVDYSTGTAGLLVEESRTNLFQYTQDFNNAYWLKSLIASVNPVADVAPDGTTTANLVVLTGAPGNNQQIYRNETRTGTYSVSYYFKASEAADVGKTVRIDTTGAGAGGFNITLTALWQRVNLIHSPTGFFQVRIISSPGFTADKFLVWGAQYEAGAFRTSYIPNLATGSTTRNADVATMTGTNFSDWFNPSEGTLLAEGVLGGGKSNTPWLVTMAGIGVNSDVMGIVWSTKLLGNITADGVSSFNNETGPNLQANGTFKGALAYKTNNSQFSSSSSISGTDTNVTLPIATQLLIARPARFQPMPNCHIQKIYYWPQRLLSSELSAFTKQG